MQSQTGQSPASRVISRQKYDSVTGSLTQRIEDVDTSTTTDEPTGWATPTGGGLHLVSDYEHDDLGRRTQELGPVHSVDLSGTATDVRRAQWTVYQDAGHEVWSGQGYATGASWDTFTLINPVSLRKMDEDGRVVEQIQATRAVTSGKLSSSDSFAQSDYVRWTTHPGELTHRNDRRQRHVHLRCRVADALGCKRPVQQYGGLHI